MAWNKLPTGLISMLGVRRVVLPLKAVQCDFVVRGGYAEVALTQVYHQENERPLDCQYLFPVPADASVFSCEAFINDRTIQGRVEERQAAVELARAQKEAGHRTALVECERDNLFTLSLTNLQPGDLIEVRLKYIQPLRRLAGRPSIEIPLNAGTRYIPGRPLLRSSVGPGIADDTDLVPDASRISPPRLDTFHPDAAFVSVTGMVEARFVAPEGFVSPSHRIRARSKDGYVRIELDQAGDVPDRDFVVRWAEQDAVRTTPRAWVCERDGAEYALIELRGRALTDGASPAAQDVHFLVDRSGSMEGIKWMKAMDALQACVSVLGDEDRVMITLFGTVHQDFAERPLSRRQLLADPNFSQLVMLGVDGGTELAPALDHAIENISRHSAGRRVNLILITDAQVGNEDQILRVMRKASGIPIHCFGIDIALNDALLRSLCQQQGGVFQSLNPQDDVASAIAELGRTLCQPVLVDLMVSEGWELAGARLPDLYAGQVCYASARNTGPSGALEMRGRDERGQPVVLSFESERVGNTAPWLAWSKERIQRLLEMDPNASQAIELSKSSGIVCRLTAFVAWDEAEKVAVAAQALVQPVFTAVATLRCAPEACLIFGGSPAGDSFEMIGGAVPLSFRSIADAGSDDPNALDEILQIHPMTPTRLVSEAHGRTASERVVKLAERLTPTIESAHDLRRLIEWLGKISPTAHELELVLVFLDQLEMAAEEWEHLLRAKGRVYGGKDGLLEETVAVARAACGDDAADRRAPHVQAEFDRRIDAGCDARQIPRASRMLSSEREIQERIESLLAQLLVLVGVEATQEQPCAPKL